MMYRLIQAHFLKVINEYYSLHRLSHVTAVLAADFVERA